MKAKLKKLSSQVIVITGATSGIGLATSRLAAERGARILLAARNAEALAKVHEELHARGASVAYVVADVSKEDDVRKIEEAAQRHFNGFDTWVNNAAVAIYGRIEDVSIEDMRQLFEINFWGVVYGCRIALPHLRRNGGALINMGSVVSDRALPLQGIYSAAKHALKGFTDTLRMELEESGAPVSVTLIKPGSIDTPYTMHAKNYMHDEPTLPPPVYQPTVVAEAILHAAEHPLRDILVGGGAAGISASGLRWPRMTDRLMQRTMFKAQQTSRQLQRPPGDNLRQPSVDIGERGDYAGYVCASSAYTAAKLRPLSAIGDLLSATLTKARWPRRQVRA